MVFDAICELAADFSIASGGSDREFFGDAGVELHVEIHGKRGRVESWAEVG